MMKIFRQKYAYNPEKPVFQSPKARTYNCMNTQTKNKNLIIIQHLQPPQFVQPSPTILQPIQIPTTAQPFSVYPITMCVSQVKKLSEPDAMYFLKCLSQCKIKKPMYSVISQQGIVCSEVEGVLPNRSPTFQELAIGLLGLDQNFGVKDNTVISKWGMEICKSIKNGESLSGSFASYGWRDPKKASQIITDPEFMIMKGRRKEESPFQQQYGLAYHTKLGICRFKYISLVKDGYQQHFYKQFTEIMTYIQQNQKLQPFLRNFRYSKDSKGIKIFSDLANQGTLSEYIANKSQMGQALSQKNSLGMLNNFVEAMANFAEQFKNKGLGTLHIKSLYVNNNKICIGEPMLITDNIEKKLMNLKKSMDYFAPEFKETLILYENLKQQNREKCDTWSFGFILHKIFTKEIPVFDPQKKPVISKTKISAGMSQLIAKCLDQYPISRPAWKDMNIKEIQKRTVMIEQVKQEENKRQEIKLGTKGQKSSEKPKSPQKKKRIVEELDEEEDKKKNAERQSQQDNLKEKEEDLDDKMPVPQQVSTKVRRVKLIIKTIIIMSMYIFIFFRPFIWSSIQIIQVRSNYASTTLHLVDNQNTRLSSVSILTDKPLTFMTNDISFDDIQNKYQCIDEAFDPIYNPSYSLLTYIQSPQFLALLLTGWLMTIVICVMKAVSMWKGGISHRPEKNWGRFWVSYGFYQLSLAALLFAHFYIYQFFYFSGATPCLSIANFQGLQPFFDSSLYLFLSNTSTYFQQVFSTLGILSIILLLSSCFHAWGPKQDQKYISSIPSIIFRFVPFFLLFLICRIGVFMLFSPTAINDKAQLLPKILKNSFQGFIGIIPQFFIMMCILAEILIQLLMYWCEKKTAESDRLARFFNIKKRKTTVDNDQSRIQHSNLDNSKMKLDASSNELY